MKLHYLLFPILFILSSCYTFKDVTISDVNRFSIKKATINEIEGEIELTLKNPNSFGFSIYRSEFDIFYGDVKLGKARLQKRVHIGANAEKSYVFILKSRPENLNLLDVLKLIGNAGSGTVRIKGDLKAGKLFIRKRFPIDYADHISLLK